LLQQQLQQQHGSIGSRPFENGSAANWPTPSLDFQITMATKRNTSNNVQSAAAATSATLAAATAATSTAAAAVNTRFSGGLT